MSQATHCSICQRSFETILAKKVHEQHTHIFVFKCDNCDTKFASERNLSNHMGKCNVTQKIDNGPVERNGVPEERLKKYEERKRKADDQMEQYTELLKNMKSKKKDSTSDDKLEITKPTNFEKKEYKQFLGKLLQEAKAKVGTDDKSRKQSSSSSVDKDKMYQKLKQVFEESRVSNKQTAEISSVKVDESQLKSVDEQSNVSEEMESLQMKKKSKAIVAFECSYCDTLFKTKETLRKHEEGHESQDNSEDEGIRDGDSTFSKEFMHAKRKNDLLPDILKREESLRIRSAELENASHLKFKDAQRKAKLLPGMKKKEDMLKRKLAKLKQKVDYRHLKKEEIAPTAVQFNQNQVFLLKKESMPLGCTRYEYQEMLEKANKLESKKMEFEKLKLKLERVKNQVKKKQQKAISSEEASFSKAFESREEKLKPIQVFEKELIKAEPLSPVPDKYEAPEMDPNFQIKLEPEISIKEEPEEFSPEQMITKSDLKPNVVPSTTLTQAEKLEKYRALKAKLKQLKEANSHKTRNQKLIEEEQKIEAGAQVKESDPVPDHSNIKEKVLVGAQGQVMDKTVGSEAMSAAEKKLKARLAREETVREVHKRIEERKRLKELEELEKQEMKSRELVTELRQEVEKVAQELEENEMKQRKKSRKELKKHLKDKIVNTVNVVSESPTVTKEEKIEKIRELDEERDNLKQKLEELNQKKLSFKKTAAKRLSDEAIEPIVKSIKLENEIYDTNELALSSDKSKELGVLQVDDSVNKFPKEVQDLEPQIASNLENSAPLDKNGALSSQDHPIIKAATIVSISESGDENFSAEKLDSLNGTTPESVILKNNSETEKSKDSKKSITNETVSEEKLDSVTETLPKSYILRKNSETDKSEDSNNSILASASPCKQVFEENIMLNSEKDLLEKETQNPHASHEVPHNEEEWKGQIDGQKLCEEKNVVSTDGPIFKVQTSPLKSNVGNPCDSEDSDDEVNALDIKYDEYESEDDDDDVGNDVFEVSTEDGDEQWKKVEIKKVYESTDTDEKPSLVTTPIIIDDLYISDDSEDDDDPELRHYLSSGCRSWADQKQRDSNQRSVPDFPLENESDEFSNDAEEINDLPSSFELPDCQSLATASQEVSTLVEVQVSLSSDYEDGIEKDAEEEKNYNSEESKVHISISSSIKETGQSDSGDSLHAPMFTDRSEIDEHENETQVSLSTSTDDVGKVGAELVKDGEVYTGKGDTEKNDLNVFVEEKNDVEINHCVEEGNDVNETEEMQQSLCAYSEEMERDAVNKGGSTPVHNVWNDFGIEEAENQELLDQQYNLGIISQECNLPEATMGKESADREFRSKDLKATSITIEELAGEEKPSVNGIDDQMLPNSQKKVYHTDIDSTSDDKFFTNVSHSESDLSHNSNKAKVINGNQEVDISGGGDSLHEAEVTDRYQEEVVTVTVSHDDDEIAINFTEEKLLLNNQKDKGESDCENSVGFMSSSEEDDSDSEPDNSEGNTDREEEKLDAKVDSQESVVLNERKEEFTANTLDDQCVPNADDSKIYTFSTEKLLAGSKCTESEGNVTVNLCETVVTTNNNEEEDDAASWHDKMKDSRQKQLVGMSIHKEVEVAKVMTSQEAVNTNEKMAVSNQQELDIGNIELYTEAFNEEELIESNQSEKELVHFYEKMRTVKPDNDNLFPGLQESEPAKYLDEEEVATTHEEGEAVNSVEGGLTSIKAQYTSLNTEREELHVGTWSDYIANNSEGEVTNKDTKVFSQITSTSSEHIHNQNNDINAEEISSDNGNEEDSNLSRLNESIDNANNCDESEKNLLSVKGAVLDNGYQTEKILHPMQKCIAIDEKDTEKLVYEAINHESDSTGNMEVEYHGASVEPDASGDQRYGEVRKEERVLKRFLEDKREEDVSEEHGEEIATDVMEPTGIFEEVHDDAYEKADASVDLRDGEARKGQHISYVYNSEDRTERNVTGRNEEEIVADPREPTGNMEKCYDDTYEEPHSSGDLKYGGVRNEGHVLDGFSGDRKEEGVKGENGEEIIADDIETTGNMESSGDANEKPEFSTDLRDSEVMKEEEVDATPENEEESEDPVTEPVINEEDSESEPDLNEDELCDREYDDMWEDENDLKDANVAAKINSDRQSEILNKTRDDTDDEESESDEEEWITLDNAQNLLSDRDVDKIGKQSLDVNSVKTAVDRTNSKSNSSSECSIDLETNFSGREGDNDEEDVDDYQKDGKEIDLQESEKYNEFDYQRNAGMALKPVIKEGLLDILDHTWDEAPKFEKLFSSEDNGAEILEMFYSGQLTRAELLGSLPSLGWVGKSEAKFLPSGWFMKMTGPVAYTFITDAAIICESAFDAIEHMVRKEYTADAVQAFENYCTNFTELDISEISEACGDNNKENIYESRHLESKHILLKDTDADDEVLGEDIMEEDAFSDSDDGENEETFSAAVKRNEGCSFDDALSDSEDEE